MELIKEWASRTGCFCSTLASGGIPFPLAEGLACASPIPIPKKDSGIRHIAVGTLRCYSAYFQLHCNTSCSCNTAWEFR